jgi:hypothetical protein
MGWLRRQWWYLTLPRAMPDLPTLAAPEPDERVRELLARFDTPDRDKRDAIWPELPRGADALPYLLEAYPRMRRMEARTSVLHEATFFARVSEHAFRLGILGCSDRSKFVRDHACGVLAYSLRRDALPALRPLLRDPDPEVRKFAEGAVHAIKRQNHSLYYGGPAGQTVWVVNRGDDPHLPEVGRDIEAEL